MIAIIAVASVLVAAILLIFIPKSGRNQQQPDSAFKPTALPAPSQALAQTNDPPVAAASATASPFDLLTFDQSEDSVTVYNSEGLGKRVSPDTAYSYLLPMLDQSIALDAPHNIGVYCDDDAGWEVEINIALEASELKMLLSMDDNAIYTSIRDNIYNPLQTAMQTYTSSGASTAVNWSRPDSSDLVMRLYIPKVNDYDELGDDPEHPQLTRYDENVFMDSGDIDSDAYDVSAWMGTWEYAFPAIVYDDSIQERNKPAEYNIGKRYIISNDQVQELYDDGSGSIYDYSIRETNFGKTAMYLTGDGPSVDEYFIYYYEDDGEYLMKWTIANDAVFTYAVTQSGMSFPADAAYMDFYKRISYSDANSFEEDISWDEDEDADLFDVDINWEEDNGDEDAFGDTGADTPLEGGARPVVIASEEVYIHCAKQALLREVYNTANMRFDDAEVSEIDDYGRAMVFVAASFKVGVEWRQSRFVVCIQAVSEDGERFSIREDMAIQSFDDRTQQTVYGAVRAINDFGEPR